MAWCIFLGLFLADAARSADPKSTPRERCHAALAADLARDPNLAIRFDSIWSRSAAPLERVVQCLKLVHPEIVRLPETLAAEPGKLPAWLSEPKLDPFVKNHALLFAGRELALTRRLDEAVQALAQVDAKQVVDPATLYFHRAVGAHALGKMDQAKEALARLRELPDVPARYRAVADALVPSVTRHDPASLTGIAHDVRDVRRRLEVGAVDGRTVAIEKDILARLDRLIKDAEDKEGGGGGSSNGGERSAKPAGRSQPLGGTGPGKTDDKVFKDKSAWGNLPEKQREQAMQDLGRAFPAHYREAVEQYFRQLAGESKTPGGGSR